MSVVQEKGICQPSLQRTAKLGEACNVNPTGSAAVVMCERAGGLACKDAQGSPSATPPREPASAERSLVARAELPFLARRIVDGVGWNGLGLRRFAARLGFAGLRLNRLHDVDVPRRLVDYALKDVDAWLEPFRKQWEARLDNLGVYLDRTTRKPKRK